jgi:hypothetical protein
MLKDATCEILENSAATNPKQLQIRKTTAIVRANRQRPNPAVKEFGLENGLSLSLIKTNSK